MGTSNRRQAAGHFALAAVARPLKVTATRNIRVRTASKRVVRLRMGVGAANEGVGVYLPNVRRDARTLLKMGRCAISYAKRGVLGVEIVVSSTKDTRRAEL